MLERTIYFSGPSGVGKSIIIKGLMEMNKIYVNGMGGTISEGENCSLFEKAIESIDRKTAEAENHMMIQDRNLGKIVLVEGCMFDCHSYITAALKSGDLTEDEVARLFEYQNREHLVDLRPKNLIFINYPVKSVQRFLQRKQAKGCFGFREDDNRYLEIVSESFEECFREISGVSVHLLRDPHGFYICDIDNAIRKMIS